MRPGVTIALTTLDRRRLGAIVGNRNVPQKHAWRAEIVLLTADGLGTVEIMRRTGKSKTCVWRWQERFAAEGVDGLLRDKTRPPRVPPLGQKLIDQVVALTATEPPHEATHWTGAAMAKAAGVSGSSAKRGVFRSVVDLQAAINRYLDEANHDPKPFIWTADPDKIIPRAPSVRVDALANTYLATLQLLSQYNNSGMLAVAERGPSGQLSSSAKIRLPMDDPVFWN